MDTSGFLRRWDAVVRRHAAADPEGRAALVRTLLDHGIDAVPPPVPQGASPAEEAPQGDRLACERDLVAASGLFDAFAYFLRHPGLWWSLCGHDEELRHFVAVGWQQLRAPSPDFDLWWYWLTYLDPSREDLNPLVHWLAEGRHLGHDPLPEVTPLRPENPAPERPVRRICLFAAYDGDGIVDDTVVAYVRELSRFADVYYLADGEVEMGELEKLAEWTEGRWARRHGGYDFGSYSLLARDLVGWDVVESYDELILANDSCYLVQPFDEVFAAMDRTPADWWGLQATYDSFDRHEQARLGRRLRVEEVTDGMRALGGRGYAMTRGPAGVNVSDDRFHVGSYFVVFRSPVVADPGFRLRLDTVAPQRHKATIVRKYEIGISRYLVLAGYRLATFVDGILPFHPAYRESAFELMRQGFPLLKRQLLAENPFDTPDLGRWQQRVLETAPEADVAAMKENLLRVSAPWGRHRGFGVYTRADGTVRLPATVSPEDFAEEDRWVPKHPHWWAFPVDPVTGRLEGNARAVFEVVRYDPSIRKILLTTDRSPLLAGLNVTIHPVASAAGQFYALRSAQVFVSRSARRDLGHPLAGDLHQFVLLGRGSPVLAFGAAMPVGDHVEDRLAHDVRLHDLDLTTAAVVASPAQARAVRPSLASGLHPRTWVTGLPRTDLLVADADALPEDLRRQEQALRNLVSSRRLVVWAPVERENGDTTALASDVVTRMADLADRRGAVLGLRCVGAGGDERVLDVSAERFPDVEMVLRVAAVLVSDYAPELLDFLVTDRPVVCFAPDLEAVREDPGLVHDLERLVPGGVRRDPDALLTGVETALGEGSAADAAAYAEVRDLLHAHRDGRSAARVVRRVQETYLPIKKWLTTDA